MTKQRQKFNPAALYALLDLATASPRHPADRITHRDGKVAFPHRPKHIQEQLIAAAERKRAIRRLKHGGSNRKDIALISS